MKTQRNKIMKKIKAEQRLLCEKDIDDISNEIENARHDNKFYKEIKYVRQINNKRNNIIFDKDGKL